MWKKLKNLFKRPTLTASFQATLSAQKIEEIKTNNLFQFTDLQTLLIKDNKVLGKINKVEKIKPGTLGKGKLTYIYLFEVTTKNDREEFIDRDQAILWLLQQTLEYWLD